ncbi:MAG: helicase [Planctomycetes bacterium]|nr:helicase [Planctomycetota bacterium]
MDNIQEASNVIVKINEYKSGHIKDYELIKVVCAFFDMIKSQEITQSDLKFLKYISNSIGIPHYYDQLRLFENETEIHDYDLKTLSSVLHECTLYSSDEIMLHKYQKNILDRFELGQLNRFVLSASTSFGKTFLVYEIIKKMGYKNILLVFPTIALLSENHELLNTHRFEYFKKFKVHTLSEVKETTENNIFLFTPERFLSYIEKNKDYNFDFTFVDEVYKIDNDYVIDDSVKENERDVAYRIALYHILLKNTDVLLAGPYIEFSSNTDKFHNPSFGYFMESNKFQLINYNDHEIVNKNIKEIKSAKSYKLDENLTVNFESSSKPRRLITIIDEINKINENCIVYCYSKSSVENYAKKIIDSEILCDSDLSKSDSLINHLKNKFNKDWCLIRALEHGVGIHHGSVPKYIQKEIINLFNQGRLKVLISTTTITEGVNTSAKNMIVLHDTKGSKPLKKFDAKNISGRAGRFQQHYSGRVIALQNKFVKIIESEAESIKHKNYDTESPKDEIDLFFTTDEYLNDSDQMKKKEIKKEQFRREIPDDILNLYKVVGRSDKIHIYDNIINMTEPEGRCVRKLISKINIGDNFNIDYQGFQIILNIISPIVKDKKMSFTIINKSTSPVDLKEYSVLTHLVYAYLKYGFIGSVNYKIERQGKNIDKAIRETSDFIYNTLKYHLVKYLGVFNIMYKFIRSRASNLNYEQISGIDKLLTKLEYNAVSENGRLASDFGVPSKIVDYYDYPNNRSQITFDDYENEVMQRIKKIINE